MALIPDSAFLAVQDALAGEYSLERELGRGGMGIVYLAREIQLDRLVAIKVLPHALAARADVRERFVREARMAAALSHPNIVPIYRVGTEGETVYFVMAFVDGETLGERLRARGPLAAEITGRVMREVAQALAYAHGRGIVHRDIKPDNIFLEQGTGRALVMDFGIAVGAAGTGDAAAADAGPVMGTAHFMSPEQAGNQPVDARSDLYSLGVVGFLAVSGRLPVDASPVAARPARRLDASAASIRSVMPGVSAPLAMAIDRCLQRLPQDRFASGEQLADALESRQSSGDRLPAALRIWAEARDPLKPLYLVWMAVTGTLTLSPPLVGEAIHISDFAVAALPFIPMALGHIRSTYRTLRSGFTIADLRMALRLWREERREELSASGDAHPPLWKRIIRGVTLGTWLSTVGSVVALLAAIGRRDIALAEALFTWIGGLATVCLVEIPIVVAAGVPMIDPRLRLRWSGSVRVAFWNSRVGDRLARLLGGRRDLHNAQFIHRPTEMALGIAAEDLYRALPASVQQDLRTLPAIVERLGRHAARARGRLERDGAPAARKALTDAVGALDAIRLDLLRLHGVIDDLRPITTVLDAAARVGEELDRQQAAHTSVNKTLIGQSPIARTPTPA